MPNSLRKYFSLKTHQLRMNQLITEVNHHPHRSELIDLMQNQLQDDRFGHLLSKGTPFNEEVNV